MQNLIPMVIDLAEVPEDERRALCAEALRRGVPFEVVIREAMVEFARKITRTEAPVPA